MGHGAPAAAYTLHRLWEAPTGRPSSPSTRAHIRAIATRGELGASAELIAALPKLELIACYGVGTDAIDLAACRARGIRVSNTPDVLNGDVADLAVGLTLALQRRIPAGDHFVRSGAWAKGALPLATRVFGQRVGIAGFGRIGSTIARRLSGFDWSWATSAATRRPTARTATSRASSAMADWCDVLIVILPGGEATRGIVDAEVLRALGPKGWLVNVSRGTTVDEGALLQALADSAPSPARRSTCSSTSRASIRALPRSTTWCCPAPWQRHRADAPRHGRTGAPQPRGPLRGPAPDHPRCLKRREPSCVCVVCAS
jgi:lactate dehydrogenase-like 2-hydroxyacid dehydrogenase